MSWPMGNAFGLMAMMVIAGLMSYAGGADTDVSVVSAIGQGAPAVPPPEDIPPSGSMVAHWKLDEYSGNTAKDSVGGMDGLLLADRHWMPFDGRIGGALLFDGIGDQIDCGNSSALQIRDRITVAAWIKVVLFHRPFQAIVTKGDSSFRLQRAVETSALEFACSGVQVAGTDYGNIYGTLPVDDGQWHHAVGTYDGQRLALYIDGRLDMAVNATGRINRNAWPLLIGENAERGLRYWNGMIDDVRIYNYALSESDILGLYRSGRTWHVNRTGGDDANAGLTRQAPLATIQAAIHQAVDGDTVLVWPGVYSEGIDFLGKAITVASAADAAILETPMGHAVEFHTGEGPSSVLRNLIIRNSQYSVTVTSGGRPTLKNLTVADNLYGVRAYDDANPTITNCIFWNNVYGDFYGENIECQAQYSWMRNDIDPQPVAWWKFDEGYGSTARDSVGASHGILAGASWTTGIVGNALEFDGETGYVLVPDNSAIRLGNRDYSISAWIFPRSLDREEYTILSKVESVSNKEYMLGIDETQPRLDVENNGNNGRAVASTNIRTGQWQHVLVTFNSNTLQATFYYNGIRQISPPFGAPITELPTRLNNHLYIGFRGGFYNGYTFNGKIDEVMLFDRVLTPEQVVGIYQKGMGPRFADPAHHDYHLLSSYGRFRSFNDPNLPADKSGLWLLDEETSPCIDAGNWMEIPVLEPVPNGGRINMGAHGGTPYASRGRWPLTGDANSDGIVDFRDFAIFSEEWLLALPWAQ